MCEKLVAVEKERGLGGRFRGEEAEYGVYESHGPNIRTEVYRGSLQNCRFLALAYRTIGYTIVRGEYTNDLPAKAEEATY